MTVSGIQQKYWVKAEATYDTVQALAATDAFGAVDLKIEPFKTYEKTRERVGTASLQYEVAGMQGGTWSTTVNIKPAAAGTAPDIGELFKAAYGTETVSGGTSVTYSLSDSVVYGTGLRSLQLVRSAGDLYEVITGAWVEQVDYEITAGAAPTVSFSGGFATYGWVYSGTTVDGNQSSSDDTILVDDASRIGVNSYIAFDDEDNSGNGYKVTAVNTTTNIITISPALANNITDTDAVTAVVPSQTLGGTIIGGVSCGLSVGGTAIGMQSGKLSYKTGIKGRDQECTTDRPNGLARGEREITGSMDCYYLDESNLYAANAWEGATPALIIRAGANTSAARMTLNAPKARIDVTQFDIPESEELTFSMNFIARQNAAAADEHTVVFD